MTVKELRALLEPLPDDETVLVAVDGEGNAFKHLLAVEPGTYDGSAYAPEVGIRELTHALAKDGFDEDDVKPIGCVVIWP